MRRRTGRGTVSVSGDHLDTVIVARPSRNDSTLWTALLSDLLSPLSRRAIDTALAQISMLKCTSILDTGTDATTEDAR